MENEQDRELESEQESAEIDDSVVSEEHLADTVKKLRDQLKQCKKERNEYLDGWQRAKADLINARKRDEADK